MEHKYAYEKEINVKQCVFMLLQKKSKIILVGILLSVLIIGYKYITSGSSMSEETQVKTVPSKDYLGMAKIYLGYESRPILSESIKSYLSGNEMLEGAIKELNLDITAQELYRMISFQNSTDFMVRINVTGSDEEMVQSITEYLATVGSSKIRDKLVDQEAILLEPAFTRPKGNVEVAVKAFSIKKLIMELVKYAVIGFVLGAFLTCGVYLTLFMLDTTIKEKRDVEGYLGVPVLGAITVVKGTNKEVEKGKRNKKDRLTQYSIQ